MILEKPKPTFTTLVLITLMLGVTSCSERNNPRARINPPASPTGAPREPRAPTAMASESRINYRHLGELQVEASQLNQDQNDVYRDLRDNDGSLSPGFLYEKLTKVRLPHNQDTSLLRSLTHDLGSSSVHETLALKPWLETWIESKLDAPLLFTLSATQPALYASEGHMQPYAATVYFEILRRGASQGNFARTNSVVIFEDSNVLPGIISGSDSDQELIGMEMTVRGSALRRFGKLRDLDQAIRIVDANDFVLLEVLSDGLQNAKEASEAALQSAAQKYRVPVDKTEAKVLAVAQGVDQSPIRARFSGSPWAFSSLSEVSTDAFLPWQADEIRSERGGHFLYAGEAQLDTFLVGGQTPTAPPLEPTNQTTRRLLALGFTALDATNLKDARITPVNSDTAWTHLPYATQAVRPGSAIYRSERLLVTVDLNRLSTRLFEFNERLALLPPDQRVCIATGLTGGSRDFLRQVRSESNLLPVALNIRALETARGPWSRELTLVLPSQGHYRAVRWMCRPDLTSVVADVLRFLEPFDPQNLSKFQPLRVASLGPRPRAEEPQVPSDLLPAPATDQPSTPPVQLPTDPPGRQLQIDPPPQAIIDTTVPPSAPPTESPAPAPLTPPPDSLTQPQQQENSSGSRWRWLNPRNW